MGRKSKGSGSSDKSGARGTSEKPKSKALANLMSYQFDDSGSMDEDSQSDTPPPPPPPPPPAPPSLNKPRSESPGEPHSESSPSTNKKPVVKFAVKRQFEKMKAFGIKPKMRSDVIKVRSKWDDEDSDSVAASDVSEATAPIGQPQFDALQSVGLYETGSSREGTPLLDEPMASQVTSKLGKKHEENMAAKSDEVLIILPQKEL